jgi:hypothetical protein
MGGITYDKLSHVFNKLRPKGVNTAPWLFFSEKGTPFGIAKLPRPLDLAVGGRDIKQVEALLDKGANPNLVTHFSGPAIKDAAKVYEPDIVKLLHKRGADVNGTDTAGGTALHAAISEMYSFNIDAQTEIIQYLLDNGARTDMKNSCDMTALEWARQLQRPEAERLIAKHMGFDTVTEIASAKKTDGTYAFPVTAGNPGDSKIVIEGLRKIYDYPDFDTRVGKASNLTHQAARMGEEVFGLGKCEAFIRETGKTDAVTAIAGGGSYELVLLPEAVIKARLKAAADEKQAFDDHLGAGLPTNDKVKGMKPISFKKPAA